MRVRNARGRRDGMTEGYEERRKARAVGREQRAEG